MKAWMRISSAVIITVVLALNVSGCSLMSGPTDEDVIKAVTETGLFSGGEEKFTLKSPMVVVEKDRFSSHGAWGVKVRLHYSYMMTGGRETKPVEKVQAFLIAKSRDSSGNIVWKAAPGAR